jgi:diguanylate cyclase (GGDEF)-like protein
LFALSLLRRRTVARAVNADGAVENTNQSSTSLNRSLEPYGQLVKMLLPRALSIDIFGPDAEKYWSSSDVVSPDLSSLIAEARHAAAGAEEGLFRLLDDGTPVYLFRLCEESGELIALLSVTCRAETGESRPWSFVHSLLRPALECLQRDLIAQVSIGTLSRSLEVRDKDLDLLLSITSDAQQESEQSEDDTDELRWIVQRSIEHLGCPFGALVIPEKGIAICRAGHGAPAAQSAEVLTRTHRHLLTWAQLQGKTLVVNKVVASSAPTALPYKILSCPVRQNSSRVVGFFALFRTEQMEDFDHRHTRIARLLARKTAAVLQTNYDSATGLLTRPAFERHANATLNRAGSETHCLVYIDIDQMHLINENFGMHIGDAVIARVAELVRRTHRPRVVGARLAGDRFALLLPDCDLDTGTVAARELCDAARLLRAEGSKEDSPDVSLSIGVAALSGSQAKLAHAMAAAEVACKAAKDRGRNRVEIYEEADVSIIRRHTDIGVAAQLRDALRTDRFRLDLQPILPLQNVRKNPHFELLLRMIADDGHSIPPEKFLSAAARYQLLPAIDRWVVEHAVHTLSEHASLLREHSICFTINLSGQSIAQPDFADFVEHAIRNCGMPSESFCFELTETAAVANMGRAETFMERLRAIGCQFALDDFGTGFSSLAYLKALPVTMLKIDGSFVRDVIVDPRSQSMVRAIAQLAQTMCMETVAEYVETDEIRRRITSLGVDYGQGFCLGKPQPLLQTLKDLPLLERFTQQALRDPVAGPEADDDPMVAVSSA